MSLPESEDPFREELFPTDKSTSATKKLDALDLPGLLVDPVGTPVQGPDGEYQVKDVVLVNKPLEKEEKQTNKCEILYTQEEVRQGLAPGGVKAGIPTKPPSRGQLTDFLFSNVIQSNSGADRDQNIYYWQTVSSLVYGLILLIICIPMIRYYNGFRFVALIGALFGFAFIVNSSYNIYTMVKANEKSTEVKVRYDELTQVTQLGLCGAILFVTFSVMLIILKKRKEFINHDYIILTPLIFFLSFGVMIITIQYLFKVLKYPNKRNKYEPPDIHKLSSDTYQFTNKNRFKIVVSLKNMAPIPKVEQLFKVSPGQHVQFTKGGPFTLDTYNGNEVFTYSSLNVNGVPRSVNSLVKMTLKL